MGEQLDLGKNIQVYVDNKWVDVILLTEDNKSNLVVQLDNKEVLSIYKLSKYVRNKPEYTTLREVIKTAYALNCMASDSTEQLDVTLNQLKNLNIFDPETELPKSVLDKVIGE